MSAKRASAGHAETTWTEPAGRVLIRRKIAPPVLDQGITPRERVEGMLVGLIGRHRLVCVRALAGSGKTTAVRQATARMDRPLAWLELDRSEMATGRLLTYLEGAISRVASSAAGVAAAALRERMAHEEVAALLAESIGDSGITVVIDNAERLAGSAGALRTVQAFARFLPASNRLVILSRTALPLDQAVVGSPWVAAIGDQELTFTVPEAAAALERIGKGEIDAAEAVLQTGGWVAGVLFEAWRSNDHIMGLGGEADPLHGYLATEILERIPAEERELLVATSILPELTAESVAELEIPEGARRFAALKTRLLPGTWNADGSAFSCHPRLREYLLKLLDEEDPHRRRKLYRAHAQLLMKQAHKEEALEELLKGECLAEALAIAPDALTAVLERGDLQLAQRWIDALSAVEDEQDTSLVTAELLLAVARENFATGAAIADRLHRRGQRTQVAARSGLTAGLMAWCYLHVGRVHEMEEVLEAGAPGMEVTAARYTLGLVRDSADCASAPFDELTGSPLDAMVMRTHFDLGRIPLLRTQSRSQWAARAAESWVAASLFVRGDVDRAFEVYHRLVTSPQQSVWLTALLGPQLLAEVGEIEAAFRQLLEGRAQIEATGSVMFHAYSLLLEAEFDIRLRGDHARAIDVLAALQSLPVTQTNAFVAEQCRALTGLALLELGDADAARVHLADSAAAMARAGRLLHLPATAVYLAEACWRTGDEAGADHAADLALAAATRQETNHFLLRALEQYPAVLTRRLDIESSEDSAWHEIGRCLMVRGVRIADVFAASVFLTEFGAFSVLLNGAQVDPRLMKSLELLALLAATDSHELTRDQILDGLFEGRKDDSSASYARQAIFRLRRAIPDLLVAEKTQGIVRLSQKVHVVTESSRVLNLVAQAAAMRGDEKLSLLLDALEVLDRGPYLPGIRSSWADERRNRLAEVAAAARFEAASSAFILGHYRVAARLSDAVLREDAYHEGAWRLRMRIAHAHGDQAAVLKAFRACATALAELGITPSQGTTALLRNLRQAS
jgi:DNA-binding SARP family transcriptional activator